MSDDGRELYVDDHRLCVRGTGAAEDFTHLSYQYRTAARRPHLSVLAGPSGRNVVESSPADHAHHLGVWWSHHDVNGIDFSLELEREAVRHGRIEHVSFDEIVDDDPWFGFDEMLEWRDPDGEVLIGESRVMLVHHGHADWYSVDLDSTYTAVTDCWFGANGAMLPGVRVAEPLAPSGGGTLTTEAPASDGGKDGRRARWLDCSGVRRAVDAESIVEGVSVMAHPENPPDADRWRFDDDGLLSAFPAGQPLDGGVLAAGEAVRLRHRLLVHRGDAESGGVDQHYHSWVSQDSLE